MKIKHERKQDPNSKFAHKRIQMILKDDQYLILGLLSARIIFISKSITLCKFNREHLTEIKKNTECQILKFERIQVIKKDNHPLKITFLYRFDYRIL